MRMAKFTRTHRVTPWGGTTQDVERVARDAQRLVTEATGEDLHFSMSVKRPGREDSYDSPEEFEQDAGGDLRSIEQIYVSVNPVGFPEKVSVVVIFFRGRAGAWMRAEGSSEVSVSGAAQALQALLDDGQRRARRLTWIGLALITCGAIVLGFADVRLLEQGKHGPHPLNDILTAVGLSLDVLGLLALAVRWLAVPSMELRRIGELTRLQRLVGRPSRWLLGVVLVAAVTAAIGVVLTKIV
jgi:hypothetical protein